MGFFRDFFDAVFPKSKPKKTPAELQWERARQMQVLAAQKSKDPNAKPEDFPLSDQQFKSVIEPIDGYTLRYHYKDVEITSWDWIPEDVKIGNRVIFIQEPTNPADDKAVMLMFVPQRRKFGYLYRGRMQDMVNDYINRGDKVVARLSYLQFKPYKLVKIDIAFYRKDK